MLFYEKPIKPFFVFNRLISKITIIKSEERAIFAHNQSDKGMCLNSFKSIGNV